MEDRGIETRKKVHLSFPDVSIWPGLADVGPDIEFVGNPVTIRTTDGRSYSARVDIPRGDPALPLTDDELISKSRDCGHSQLRGRHRAQCQLGCGAREGGRDRDVDGYSRDVLAQGLGIELVVSISWG